MPSKKGPALLKIASVDELKEGQSKKFQVKNKNKPTEAFLIKKGGKHYAYLNFCRHWLVGLDFDDNEFFSEDKAWLVCKNHGALYEPATGVCAGGPCGGAGLYVVPLIEKGNAIYVDVAKIDWGGR